MDSAAPLTFWETLQLALRQHEYIHTLLHPLPVYGLAMGVIALIVALCLRNRQAEVTALFVVVIAALTIWPVVHYGKSSYDGVYGLTGSINDDDGVNWLKEHRARGESLQWIFYAVASLGVTALALPPFLPKTARWLVVATLLAALGALGAGGWISYAGGRVKHKEFRYGPPPIRTSATP